MLSIELENQRRAYNQKAGEIESLSMRMTSNTRYEGQITELQNRISLLNAEIESQRIANR